MHPIKPEQHQTVKTLNDLHNALHRVPLLNKPKNVIVLLGDGQGHAVNYAARLHKAKLEKFHGQLESYETEWDKMPQQFLMKTHTVDYQAPDSAGAGASMFSGVKHKGGTLNVLPNLPDSEECVARDSPYAIKPLADLIKEQGYNVGVISNTDCTHATPAATYAVSKSRGLNHDGDIDKEKCPNVMSIGAQLMHQLEHKVVDVAMCGMKEYQGGKVDGFFENSAFTLLNNTQYQSFDFKTKSDKSIIYMGSGDVKANKDLSSMKRGSLTPARDYEHAPDGVHEPRYHQMVLDTMDQLKAKGGKGYFIMAEAGIIDWMMHVNNLHGALDEAVEIDNTIKAVKEKLIADGDTEDTLLIVTADHSLGISFTGRCGSGSDVLGYCQYGQPTPDLNKMERLGNVQLDADKKPMSNTISPLGGNFGYFNRDNVDAGWEANAVKGQNPNCTFASVEGWYVPLNDTAFTEHHCVTEHERVGDDHYVLPYVYKEVNQHTGVDVVTRCEGPMDFMCQGTKDNTYLGTFLKYIFNAL